MFSQTLCLECGIICAGNQIYCSTACKEACMIIACKICGKDVQKFMFCVQCNTACTRQS